MTPDELRRRAERAAAAIIARYNLDVLGVSSEVLVPVLAVGWLEGWQDAGDQARSLVADALAEYARRGIHSVPS